MPTLIRPWSRSKSRQLPCADVAASLGVLAPLRIDQSFASGSIATLTKRSHYNILDSAEIRLLLRVLTESQNVNRYSFSKNFFARYTNSVSGAETQIVSNANHVVLGRRGAGKSMLLLYAWHDRKRNTKPSVWIDMQVYSGRDDYEVISDVLIEILDQVQEELDYEERHRELEHFLGKPNLSLKEIRIFLPNIRRYLAAFSSSGEDLFVFIDDLHVISESLQPLLLDVLYAISRGNGFKGQRHFSQDFCD